jgi:hypothetical protein
MADDAGPRTIGILDHRGGGRRRARARPGGARRRRRRDPRGMRRRWRGRLRHRLRAWWRAPARMPSWSRRPGPGMPAGRRPDSFPITASPAAFRGSVDRHRRRPRRRRARPDGGRRRQAPNLAGLERRASVRAGANGAIRRGGQSDGQSVSGSASGWASGLTRRPLEPRTCWSGPDTGPWCVADWLAVLLVVRGGAGQGHRDPRTTRRYDRARQNLDRTATYAVAAFLAGDDEDVPTQFLTCRLLDGRRYHEPSGTGRSAVRLAV